MPTMSMDTIGILGVLEDARQRAFGGCLHSGVDLLDGDLALKLDRQVDHGAVGRGNARCEAVELALASSGRTKRHGASGARGGRDHGHGCGAGAAQVLMRQVEDLLIVGVGMDGVHVAALDAELLKQHLGERGPGSWWCRRRWR